jgi:hypothetical protein
MVVLLLPDETTSNFSGRHGRGKRYHIYPASSVTRSSITHNHVIDTVHMLGSPDDHCIAPMCGTTPMRGTTPQVFWCSLVVSVSKESSIPNRHVGPFRWTGR